MLAKPYDAYKHEIKGGFRPSVLRFSSRRSVRQRKSFLLFVCLFSRVSGSTLFSGESCNKQFSAPRSQTAVLTVNMSLYYKADTELRLHDYVYF